MIIPRPLNISIIFQKTKLLQRVFVLQIKIELEAKVLHHLLTEKKLTYLIDMIF
jgi:hypothetical protein